jgi:hypothetical protein
MAESQIWINMAWNRKAISRRKDNPLAKLIKRAKWWKPG